MIDVLTSVFQNVSFDYKKISIDNWVFKLHYRLTFAYLLLSASLLYFEIFKEKISCTHSDTEEDSNKKISDAMNKYCFFMSLFTVPHHFNRSVPDREASHPGVGPYKEGEDKTSVLWYQWVPYVLYLQCICFYVPHILWKYLEGNRIKKIIQNFDNLKLQDHVGKEKLDEFFDEAYFKLGTSLPYHKDWHFKLILCEFLNLLNVLLQMSVTDWFLGGKFWTLGTNFHLKYGVDNYNYLDVVFPKVAKCTLRRFGVAGSIQNQDILCILPLNIVNEKMFLILWYWYIFVITCSALVVIHRLLSQLLYANSPQYNIQALTVGMVAKPDRKDTRDLLKKLDYAQFVFFNQIIKNMDPFIATFMISSIARKQRQIESKERSSRQ